VAQTEARLTDRNGKLVEAFSLEMANLGFERVAEHIAAMLETGAWRDWQDGLGRVHLLPGEFDYFLSMCGVTRETVMHGIRDVATKARLEEAMDERRAGDNDYRRRYPDVRATVGPHRKAEPFGYTQAEVKDLVDDSGGQAAARHRSALGDAVRRYRTTGSAAKPSRQRRSRVEQIEASIARLADDELDELATWLTEHRRQRASRNKQDRRRQS
jgi:hypothetical protein